MRGAILHSPNIFSWRQIYLLTFTSGMCLRIYKLCTAIANRQAPDERSSWLFRELNQPSHEQCQNPTGTSSCYVVTMLERPL